MTLQGLYDEERARIAKLSNGAGDYLHPVFGEGCAAAPALLLLGEAPGGEEAKQGHPFVGKAGKQLDELLLLAGIRRAEIFITNAVKYRPVRQSARGFSNRTPLGSEVRAGLPLLRNELLLVRPRAIATLGNTPLRAAMELAGQSGGTVGALHGQRVMVQIGGADFPLFPLYHPASVIYNRALAPVLEADLLRLGGQLREGGRAE